MFAIRHKMLPVEMRQKNITDVQDAVGLIARLLEKLRDILGEKPDIIATIQEQKKLHTGRKHVVDAEQLR